MKTILGIMLQKAAYNDMHQFCLVGVEGDIYRPLSTGCKKHSGDLAADVQRILNGVSEHCISGRPDEIMMSKEDCKLFARAVNVYLIDDDTCYRGNTIFGIPLRVAG